MDKKLLRRQLRQAALSARAQLSEAQHQQYTGQLIVHLSSLLAQLSLHTLAFCWPFRAEPDLRQWAQSWQQTCPEQRRLALPVVIERNQPLLFREWYAGAPMVTDVHGISTPHNTAILQPDVLLIPLNAFDAAGYRLGYGGGYFDRTLAQNPHCIAVGVGFEVGRVDNVHPLPHDVPMHWIVTEAQISAHRSSS